MCGICGYVGYVDEEMISRMTETLQARGPDDSGTAVFPKDKLAFGHQRLSILDLSNAGHQPMLNSDKSICITYNGETYNFMELRDRLMRSGVRFHSSTDTEVILACYEESGIDMVTRLDGIFAFAIYDSNIRRVYLVRDHLGVKPLYYSFNNGKFFFGSEIKAILASNKIVSDINIQSISDYLTYHYVPCPLTMYKGIYQVPPANIMTLDLITGEYSFQRYWNPLENLTDPISDPQEIDYLLRRELSQTVKEQVVSDVPVGAFLSGGIDSNIVVGLMDRHSNSRVRTFTAIFTDKNASYFNEKEAARRIAKKFNTNHEEVEIPTPTLGEITKMLSWTDQPFGNPTLFLSYLISRQIKKHVSVALSGAGGDELFGGYVRYRHFELARNIVEKIPFNISPFAEYLLKVWPYHTKPELRNRAFKFFHGLVPDIAQHYLRWAYFLEEEAKSSIIMEKCGEDSIRILEALFDEGSILNDTINMLEYVDIRSYLVDDILEYTDKSSMATSLEVRVPFLSPKMVELSLRIPGDCKINGEQTKIPLRKAFSEFFPRENLNNPKKGFSAPSRIWASALEDYFDQMERRLPSDCPLNLQRIKELREEHKKGRFDHGQNLFSILMLQVWLADSIYGTMN